MKTIDEKCEKLKEYFSQKRPEKKIKYSDWKIRIKRFHFEDSNGNPGNDIYFVWEILDKYSYDEIIREIEKWKWEEKLSQAEHDHKDLLVTAQGITIKYYRDI